MTGDGIAKEILVFGLNIGHIEQIFDAVIHLKFACKGCSVFVLDRVLTLKPSCKIHRHKPAGYKARGPERPADEPKYLFTYGLWLGPKLFEPYTDATPMIPFLSLDLFDTRLFRRIRQ